MTIPTLEIIMKTTAIISGILAQPSHSNKCSTIFFFRHLFHFLSEQEKKIVKSLGYKVLHDLQTGMIHSPSVLVASVMLQNLQGLHFGKFKFLTWEIVTIVTYLTSVIINQTHIFHVVYKLNLQKMISVFQNVVYWKFIHVKDQVLYVFELIVKCTVCIIVIARIELTCILSLFLLLNT